jgi:hypothetical protein
MYRSQSAEQLQQQDALALFVVRDPIRIVSISSNISFHFDCRRES